MRPRGESPGRSAERPWASAKLAWKLLRRFVIDMDRTRTLGLAAELAFWLFFSLIPLAAVAGMVAAKVAVENADVSYQVFGALPAPVHEFVARQLNHVAAWNGGAVGVKATVVFVWLASSGVHAIFDAIELKTEARRSWLQKRLLAIAACIVLSVGVALVAVLVTGLSWFTDLLEGVLPREGFLPGAVTLTKIVRLLAGGAAAVGLVAGLYWVGFPPRDRRRLPIWPGAILAVGLQIALGFGYALYISRMGVGSAYSAGLAVIGVTLIALYLFSVALLAGAQLNSTLASFHDD
jgi:membrane protein